MIRPFGFLSLSLLFAAALYAVALYVPVGDPFTNQPDQRLVFLDKLPLPAFAELKLRHVERQPRYDIGLFGNSRSLGVGTRHLSLGNCRFFNFSIGSESFRYSVANLERLQEIGKAPKLAVISLDHLELQRYNNPISFFAATRWKKAVKDMLAGLTRDDIGFGEFLRMGWRHLWIEVKRFKMAFNPESFSSGIKNLFSNGPSFRLVAQTAKGYYADGSRNSPELTTQKFFSTPLKSISRQIRAGYFRFDLERLGRLQKLGTQVVIYESHLEPKSAALFLQRPSPQASAARKTLNSACAQLGLNCYSPPGRLNGDEGLWTDQSHPPAKSLGSYLNTLLDENRLVCSR